MTKDQGLMTKDNPQFLADVGQHLTTVGRHQHVVFDANSAPAGQIDSWLNREDHARLENGLRVLPYGGSFMHLQSQAMTEAMSKKLAEALLFDHGPGLGIDVVRLCARADGPNGLLLG